jgi:hypothetical protein
MIGIPALKYGFQHSQTLNFGFFKVCRDFGFKKGETEKQKNVQQAKEGNRRTEKVFFLTNTRSQPIYQLSRLFCSSVYWYFGLPVYSFQFSLFLFPVG